MEAFLSILTMDVGQVEELGYEGAGSDG
uniref:Uncharacterized protein n=1 Tax=Arundo donax TaxID=35708 RepID=A0A0A9AQR4_ARUDO